MGNGQSPLDKIRLDIIP